MKKSIPQEKILKKILFMVSILAAFSVNAQLQTEFSPRYSETINGDFTMIANNVISRHATNSYNGEESNHNFNDNIYVDIDNDISTFNSSSANLANPSPQSSCLSIEKVFLYWAAADKEYEVHSSGVTIAGDGGTEVSWNYDQIKLMLPGSTDYEPTITADEVIYRGRDEHFINDPYICFKDITDQVMALDNPFGTYQIANVKATEGSLYSHGLGNTGTSGGWQIVVVYQSPSLVQKNITLFDGYAHITELQNNFDVTFNGFQTVPNGNVKANVVIGSLEGDRGLFQDQLLILNTSGIWEPLSTTMRSADNFFNSSITSNGTNFIDRSPASTNTLGYDASLFDLRNDANQLITNNQTSAVLRMTSDQETYGLYLLGMAIEVWEPSLNSLDLYSMASNENPKTGEIVQIYLDVANTGNDNIRNLTFTTNIPEEMIFIGVDPLPNEISYSFDNQTNELIFSIADGFTDISSAPYTLQYSVRIQDDAYFASLPACTFDSNSQTLAIFAGEINTTPKMAYSSFTFNDCGIGNGDPTLISIGITDIQPPVFVEELPVDITVECGQVPDAVLLTAVDNCDTDPTVIFEESATNDRNCETGYEITRTWTATDDMGNEIIHTQIIKINPNLPCNIDDLVISKTITMNGDGVNDMFEITGLEGCDYIYNVKIFNRWGNIVYESNDYENEWGGTAPNNSMGNSGILPSGTYYYIIGFEGIEVKPVNGYIYIGSN